ncbi:hypothetical protein HUU53_03955 [Candidatus Micrarchaeota archaeon]|nr:hypothetical protein [Candidatus Micrarchaeota archaeon]
MISSTITAVKKVLKTRLFKLVFALLFFGVAYFFVYLTSIPGQSFNSWFFSVSDYTKLFVFLLSLLTALILTIQAYVIKNYGLGKIKKRAEAGLFASLLSGIIATACCSPFIVAFFGLSSAAFFVATNQTWFFLIAVLVLLVSLYYTAKIVYCEECQVKIGVKR